MKQQVYALVTDRAREAVTAIINKLSREKDIEVVVRERKRNRSLAQNRLMWQWLKCIADYIEETTGEIHSDEAIHEWMKAKFLPTRVATIKGEVVKARKSTKALKVGEMSEYLNKIDMYCSRDLGLVLPHPEELYREAMGLKAAPMSASR